MPGTDDEHVSRSDLRAQQRAAAVAGGLPELLDEPPPPVAPSVALPLALARLLPGPSPSCSAAAGRTARCRWA